MNKPEALKFLIARLTVLNSAAEALYENKTFSRIGDWDSHMTLELMRSQLPTWIRTMEKGLNIKEPAVEKIVMVKTSDLHELDDLARTTLDNFVGDDAELIEVMRNSLMEIEAKVQEMIPYGE